MAISGWQTQQLPGLEHTPNKNHATKRKMTKKEGMGKSLSSSMQTSGTRNVKTVYIGWMLENKHKKAFHSW